ncbi:hypothetical protein BH18ACT9_BH18ACT9_01270 [soil metagenome]
MGAPEPGAVEPSVFIPLAEQTGLIVDIGSSVLEQACRDWLRWPGAALEGLSVAVNVSPVQLMSAGFALSVEQILAETGMPPGLVTLEVTESVLIRDRNRALVVLRALRHLGVQVALDDFGTGSSSLSHLRDYPVDVVKIGRAFVAELGEDSISRHIVEAVVTLAHRLGMRVVAEGVESDEVYDAVATLGCDSYQGYLFSPAMSAEDFALLLN